MLLKAVFKRVVEVRPFTTRDGKNKFTVVYLIESNYSRRDGSVGSQELLVEVVYDTQPQIQVGEVADMDVYEFELFFKVNPGRLDPNKYFQKILCTKVSKSIV